MTLAFNSSVTTGSAKDACLRGSGTEIIILTSGDQIQRWSLTTGTQQGANIAVTSGDAIGMVTTDIVAVSSFGTTTVKLVNLVTTTVTSVPSMDFCLTTFRNQQIAGDIANGVALGIAFTYPNVIRFSSTGPTATLLTARWSSASPKKPTVIVYKSALRFIVGTQDARIIEINDQAVEQRSYSLPLSQESWKTSIPGTSARTITGLHYHQGWLLVSCTDGFLYLMNHETGDCLQRYYYEQNSSSLGPIISQEGGITCITAVGASASGTPNVLVEWDIFRTPMRQMSYVHGSVSANALFIGIDGSKVAAVYSSSTTMQIYDLSSVRATTNQTSSLTDGGPVKGDVLVVDDTGGSGNAAVLFYTPIASGGQSVPVTTGLTDILKVGSRGEGVDEKHDLRRTTS